jgi:hypothetical protein
MLQRLVAGLSVGSECNRKWRRLFVLEDAAHDRGPLSLKHELIAKIDLAASRKATAPDRESDLGGQLWEESESAKSRGKLGRLL